MRQKVGNYPGITVERKTGTLTADDGRQFEVVDVPGTYNLHPKSLDEEVAYRVLIGAIEGGRAPDLAICVVDAANLERNLYLVCQLLDLGLPTIVALNMMDAAAGAGLKIDVKRLSRELRVPVIPMVASRGTGMKELKEAVLGPPPPCPPRRWHLEAQVRQEVDALVDRLGRELPELTPEQRFVDALRAVAHEGAAFFETHHDQAFWQEVRAARQRLQEAGITALEQVGVSGRYAWLTPLVNRVVRKKRKQRPTASDRVDTVVTHPLAGPLIFLAVLMIIFQSVFTAAVPLMDGIDFGVGALSEWLERVLPDGMLTSLLVDGVVAGFGAVIIFLPQILILFFFLGLMEDSGYMARAAFIMDRLMKRFGMSGRSVVPLVSSFACAVPGIMATRTIENRRDRLVTILVAPLLTCSARLPVYTLLIGAFVPQVTLFGIFGTQGAVLLALYLAGIAFAVLAGAILRRFVIRGGHSAFIIELPPYRAPRMRDVLYHMVERAWLFVTRAGAVIISISIVLWFLASFPDAGSKPGLEERRARLLAVPNTPTTEQEEALAQIEGEQARYAVAHSYIGRMGRSIEPVIAPLGFDWKIGVALISSFAAREVAVSALGTIYSIQDADEGSESLRQRIRNDINPRTGKPVFTTLTAVSLMVFYVLACLCMSTLAVVKRETNGWRWPLFMLGYMSVLAYVASLVTYQGGRLLGFG
jgi:ferrous iron transport protein B